MTVPELVATTREAGVRLSVHGDRLVLEAPAGRITRELRDELKARKADLLPVLVRLDGMRATVGKVPIPCAVLDAMGGPGLCFSCGAALPHADAYGRCAPCDIAAELFYRECPDAAERWEPGSA